MIGPKRKTVDFHVRLTEAEAQEIYDRAKAEHRSVSNWLGHAALKLLQELREADAR